MTKKVNLINYPFKCKLKELSHAFFFEVSKHWGKIQKLYGRKKRQYKGATCSWSESVTGVKCCTLV